MSVDLGWCESLMETMTSEMWSDYLVPPPTLIYFSLVYFNYCDHQLIGSITLKGAVLVVVL